MYLNTFVSVALLEIFLLSCNNNGESIQVKFRLNNNKLIINSKQHSHNQHKRPFYHNKYKYIHTKPAENTDEINQYLPIADSIKLDKITVQNNDFVDNKGRKVIFHGLNAVEKKHPWYPQWLLNDTNISILRQYGFNIIRLGTMWTGVMPVENQANQTYVKTLQKIVSKLGQYGIYVILDMHQDVLSSEFGSYDGVPKWLVDKLPKSKHSFPWPFSEISTWTDGYLTDAVGKAFQGIYDNYAGARDHLVSFWKIIASNFKQFNNVLGYELINEPWAGDIYSHPSLLLPGVAGRKNLKPLYDVLNSAIREYDTRTILFYEPVTWGMVSNGSRTGCGFDDLPGGQNYRNRSALSYHYYCWLLTQTDSHNPYPSLEHILCDRILGPRIFKNAYKDVKKIGGASFLTEFGLCGPDGLLNSTSTMECDFVLREADKNIQSWTYWGSSDFQSYCNFTIESVSPFVRIYPMKIAGHPLKMQYNLFSKTFLFKFNIVDKLRQVLTEIFIPKLHFPYGFIVVTQKPVQYNYDENNSILRIDVSRMKTRKVKIYIRPI